MSETKLSTFPSNKLEALTMLYLENQDLSKTTPEELVDVYHETLKKIKDRSTDTFPQRRNNASSLK